MRRVLGACTAFVAATLAACPQTIRVADCGDADACTDASNSLSDGGGACTLASGIGRPVTVPEPAGIPLVNVQSLAFDSTRNLYALCSKADGGAGYVVELSPSPEHRLIRAIGDGILGAAVDFTVDPWGNLYVVQFDSTPGNGRIVVFAPDGGLGVVWPDPSDAGLLEAFSITMDSASRVYIGESVVQTYTTSGTDLDAGIGTSGCGTNLMSWPIGLVWTTGGLWVADLSRNMVEVYDVSSGNEINEFGGKGCGHGQFDCNLPGDCTGTATFFGPTRLAVDSQGNVLANDPVGSRVEKFSPGGAYLSEFDFNGPQDIEPIAVEPASGNVYVGRERGIDILCPF